MNPEEKIRKIENALDELKIHETNCRLCPRECGVNRTDREKGFCGTGGSVSLSHALPHFGEEPVLSGQSDCKAEKDKKAGGSGTLFFSGCNLKCLFCQNHQISWNLQGKTISAQDLAEVMLDLQRKGALNINLVSPSHLILPILKGLHSAYSQGLSLPLVYNSSGYEKADVLTCLEGIVDIYLPDLKYFSSRISERYSGAPDYFTRAGPAVLEMARQQPVLETDENGNARRGLIIRHLVLPGQADESLKICRWISAYVPVTAGLSLMSQYHPCFKAPPEIQRQVSREEYGEVLSTVERLALDTLFIQPQSFETGDHLIPDFNKTDPFGFE
jgi:putative pyruvate formate lyase activating enzyme